MTTIKQLYSLQEVDLALDEVNGRIAEVEQELETRLSLGEIEEALEQGRVRLQEIQSLHRDAQQEAERLRERAFNLDAQLYSGDITNPRELETLQMESNNTKYSLEQQDVRLLEFSLQAEDTRHRIETLEQQFADTQTAWSSRQTELWVQLEELTERQATLTAERKNMASGVDAVELTRYEGLRKSKGGQAVSRVMRGLCLACRMSLPTQHLQRVRSGRQTVLCNSCGRMLLPG